MSLSLVVALGAGAPLGVWPASPLDAERGPMGVNLIVNPKAASGSAQWDVSENCMHSGLYGYRVVIVSPFENAADATLALPAFPASSYAAVRLSLWARALLPPDSARVVEPPRLKLVFSVGEQPTPAVPVPAALASRRPLSASKAEGPPLDVSRSPVDRRVETLRTAHHACI